MRWILPFCLLLLGMTPIGAQHDTQQKVDDEFKNLYQQVQPLQYKTFASTPNLVDLQDGQIAVISSMTYVRPVIRINQEIYTLNGSCITVRR